MAKPQVLGHWFTEASLLEIIFSDGKQAAVSKGRNQFCLELRNGSRLLAYVRSSAGEDSGPAFEACGQKSRYALYVQKALRIVSKYKESWGTALAEDAIARAASALWLSEQIVPRSSSAAFRFPHNT